MRATGVWKGFLEWEDTTGLWVMFRDSLPSEVVQEQEEQVEQEELLEEEELGGLVLITD